MTTASERLSAVQMYQNGLSFFQEGNYRQAISELQKAEEAFRRLIIRGCPCDLSLANGVSGIANALSLEGRCRQNLGDYRRALTCYETSLINEKFEKKKYFRAFLSDLRTDLLFCYEQELNQTVPETLHRMEEPFSVDISFLFPFSLPQEFIPVARLYELDPGRYRHFQDFYKVARNRDQSLRQAAKNPEKSFSMKLQVFASAIVVSVWIAYGLMVARTLVGK